MRFLLIVFFVLSAPLAAAIDAESLEDPVMHKRYMAIIGELRCLVCQNQTILDSEADLAKDLRRQVRTQLLEGRSDQEILDFMTTRYGDYVRYRPPLSWSTAGLWFGPLLIALFGIIVFGVTMRRHLGKAEGADD